MEKHVSQKEIEKILTTNKLRNSENDLQRIPYEHVLRLLNKIRHGVYQEIYFPEFTELKDHAGVSASEKKLWEYYTVSAVTLFVFTAVDSGVSSDRAFDLSDAMLARLEKADTLHEMHEIIILSASLFAYMVHQGSVKDNSYLIKQAKNYINSNIYSKIYLDDIAAHVKVHPSYLSRCFSKQENMTISNYIMQKKMKAACGLLKHSDLSIAEISQYLSISSQSNFTTTFKKWTGRPFHHKILAKNEQETRGAQWFPAQRLSD